MPQGQELRGKADDVSGMIGRIIRLEHDDQKSPVSRRRTKGKRNKQGLILTTPWHQEMRVHLAPLLVKLTKVIRPSQLLARSGGKCYILR